MKRICLILMLTALLLAGCAKTEPETVATVSPGPVSVTVGTVDEFLEAIGPDTEIILEAGVYNLHDASGYGLVTENPYYKWVDSGYGYQLNIQNVENLIIRGSGEAEIVTVPRYAHVLYLQDCANVYLSGFTAGHTDGGECAGGVICLHNCGQVEMTNLSLYGCGTTGVRADSCKGVSILGCEIFECSSNGIQADNTDGLRVENCTIHDLGKAEFAAGEVFWLSQCENVNIVRCNVSHNRVLRLLNCRPAAGIELRETVFSGNQVRSSVFALEGGGLVMDGCQFVDNEIRSWFAKEGDTVLDGIGKSWNEEMLDAWYDPPTAAVPAGARTEVVVSTVDELIAAIAPDTEIILKDGEYDLSTAEGYGESSGDFHCWSEEFDGPALTVYGVDNLVLRSESGDSKKCSISAVPRYANVFSFKTCTNITVSGITAGHTVEPGYCMGGVLYYEDCDHIRVSNCGLYGCGILGVQAEYCSGIAVTGCEVYECSYGGIQMGHCSGIQIENCAFRDLGGEAIRFYECKDVTVDGVKTNGNARLSY